MGKRKRKRGGGGRRRQRHIDGRGGLQVKRDHLSAGVLQCAADVC